MLAREEPPTRVGALKARSNLRQSSRAISVLAGQPGKSKDLVFAMTQDNHWRKHRRRLVREVNGPWTALATGASGLAGTSGLTLSGHCPVTEITK